MKFKKIIFFVMLGFTAVIPFMVSAASSVGVNDSAVMQYIVRSQMLPVEMSDPKETGTLLLSDCPEYAEGNGILYSDYVKGDCRLYFYHVNQMNGPRKIVVLAYNPLKRPVTVFLNRFEYASPSDAYYQVGKELSRQYYEGVPTVSKIIVPPMAYALIGERSNNIVVQPNQLYSAILDMSLPEWVQISSVIMPSDADPIAFMKQQAIYLPSDSVKLRGTFNGMDRTIQSIAPYTPANGISYIKLADGITDQYLQGQDVLDNRHSQDTGNYGVDYNIDLQTNGKGKIHLYFNPQGGAYAGVIELIYNTDRKPAGNSKHAPVESDNRKLVEVPAAGIYSMGDNDPYAMQYVDTFDAGTHVNIHLMPPGAANLPVQLILVPDDAAQSIVQKVNQENEQKEKMRLAALAAQREAALRKSQENHDNTQTNQQDNNVNNTNKKAINPSSDSTGWSWI